MSYTIGGIGIDLDDGRATSARSVSNWFIGFNQRVVCLLLGRSIKWRDGLIRLGRKQLLLERMATHVAMLRFAEIVTG
jgi:hypothetical protein